MMNMIGRWRLLLVALCANSAWGLNITSVAPVDYQMATLTEGGLCRINDTATITSIPPALSDGTLVRTDPADAADPALQVQFQIDERAMVYVCYDRRGPVPDWLSSWVRTDMILGVSDSQAGYHEVYARRFSPGLVTLQANAAPAMYFVVVKPSVPVLPRNGWVLLSYDMPYLREIIKQAPHYNVNHIQLSHDIVMFSHELLNSPIRRGNINELIDLAHAYGVPEVTLWTHELATYGMPMEYRAEDGRVDGDNPGLWTWMQGCYQQLLAPGTGCPEADGIILTFDEVSMFNEGVEVFNRNLFKHDCSPAQSLATVLNKVQEVCAAGGKSLYARTWAGTYQDEIRDAIALNGDPAIWMMNKNVGDPRGYSTDWLFMDSHHPCIGTLPPEYPELLEFDICGEYLGRGKYTFAMTSYLKDHWNYGLDRGVDGAVARIDREGSPSYYTSNRLNLHALKEIIADRHADPATVNLAFCQTFFPPEAAQDLADHYDAPDSPWEGDTRYMTWEAFQPILSPTTNAQAIDIAMAAIERIDRHRPQLEMQTTLDTRDGKTDYQTLRYGIALAMLDLGGTLPEAHGFSGFQPKAATSLTPDCMIQIRVPAPGLDITSLTCEYSVDDGENWTAWPVTSNGLNGSVELETLSALAVPFHQLSEDSNLIRFTARSINGTLYQSGRLRVRAVVGPAWGDFSPVSTKSLTPTCTVNLTTEGEPLIPAETGYSISRDGGLSWMTVPTSWTARYECDALPLNSEWFLAEGQTGYESIINGVLHINDNGTSPGQKVKYARNWTVQAGIGATVVARIRCLSGGHFYAGNLFVSDSAHSEALYLKANGMIGLANYGTLIPVDTQQWHIYRITILNQDINVYLDENPEPIISANGAFIHGEGSQRLMIGSGSSAGTQEIQYDYVYWTTLGAFAPTSWYQANYSGDSRQAQITAVNVPFNQYADQLNKIRFRVLDITGQAFVSPSYNVAIRPRQVDPDGDGDVDKYDLAKFLKCLGQTSAAPSPECVWADFDGDNDVDLTDFGTMQRCLNGSGRPPPSNCE